MANDNNPEEQLKME